MKRVNDVGKDDWRLIVSAILLSKAAVATFSLAPFLLGAYVDHLSLSAREASQVLSAEIIGIACANILAALVWIHRADGRKTAIGLLVTLATLNLTCTSIDAYGPLLAMRFVIGIVEGSLLALGFGLLGTTIRPDRNFGLLFATSLMIGGINVRALPVFLPETGATGLFANLALYSVAALLTIAWVPSGRVTAGAARAASGSLRGRHMLPVAALVGLLAANYIYFIGQGGVWAFLERWGLQRGLELEAIAGALSLSLFAGVAGGLAAAWLDRRFGRALPLAGAIVAAIAAIGLIRHGGGAVAFGLGACLFIFFNNFGHPYILGLASSIDDSSRLTVLSGALHTGGQATGPFLVGLVVSDSDFSNALLLGTIILTLTLIILLPVMYVADKTVNRQATRLRNPNTESVSDPTP